MAPSNSDSTHTQSNNDANQTTAADLDNANNVIALKGEFYMPCSHHFYSNPPVLVEGKGATLTDSRGKTYADFFAGVSVMSCGHCNDFINARVIEQIGRLQHTTSVYLTQPVMQLAQRLAGVLPGKLKRSFFCNSGSEANEGAMLLARMHTGRSQFLALENSLHGRTFLTSGANGIPMWRTDPFINQVPVTFARDADHVCQILEERGQDFAALLVEPIQGNGGIRPLSKDFFAKVGPLLKEKGVLVIDDEIQTGFGRSGKMFAIEHYGVVPDILTGAKALGNGFPIGFFSAGDEVGLSFNKPSASTLGGNPVSCTAALAVLDFIEQEDLVGQARSKGELLKDGLQNLSRDFDFLGDARGIGLMQGLPVTDSGASSTTQDDSPDSGLGMNSAQKTDFILEAMKDRGYLIGKNGVGRNVLAFQPPIVIEKDVISAMLAELRQVLGQIN